MRVQKMGLGRSRQNVYPFHDKTQFRHTMRDRRDRAQEYYDEKNKGTLKITEHGGEAIQESAE